MSVSPPETGERSWDRAWTAALHELELDVEESEALLRAVHAGADLPAPGDVMRARWQPRRGLGQLPIPLRERASALLDRQREVTRQLLEAAHATRKHARAAASMRESAPAIPVYLDVAL